MASCSEYLGGGVDHGDRICRYMGGGGPSIPASEWIPKGEAWDTDDSETFAW
jgi:hypothetical protein